MRLILRGAAALLVTVFVLAIPSQADAQIEWIRRLSGPQYTGVFARFGVCLGKDDAGNFSISCGVGGVGLAANDKSSDPDRQWEYQVTMQATYGWDGDNADAGIFDTRLWVLEPQFRILYLTNGRAPAIVVGAGPGWHRFSGGTIPETFSRWALLVNVGIVYPNPRESKWVFWGTTQKPKGRLFVELGARFRWFPDGLLNSEFGGTIGDDETDTIGWGLYGMLGFRFGR